MAELITNFIKIGQAGNTVDGRVIREDWLNDMAESYDPATYTALIWPEHMRWSGNYGEVVELKAEKDESGVLCLYARLKPNYLLLWQNAAGQKLFYSMEIRPDFAKSGKAYLEGLAVTDSPASLGMESTRFSARKQHPDSIFIGNVALEPFEKQAETESLEDDHAPRWFKRCLPFLFTTNEDGNVKDMEARLKAIEDKFAALEAGLDERFAALAASDASAAAGGKAEAEAGQADGRADGKTDGQAGDQDKGEFSGKAEIEALKGELGELRQDVSAFMDELRSTVKPGTKSGESSGPAEGARLL